MPTSMTFRAAVVSVLLFLAFVTAWHVSTRGLGAVQQMDPEYAKLMGTTATQGKSAMPGPLDVGEKLWELKVCLQCAQRNRGMRCGAASRTNDPCRVQRQTSSQRWEAQSLRGQCGGTNGAQGVDMLLGRCSRRAPHNHHRTSCGLTRVARRLA